MRWTKFAVALGLAFATSGWAEGIEWFPSRVTYTVAQAETPGVATTQAATEEKSGLSLELGTGVGIMSGIELTVSLALGVADFPESWDVIGGERLFIFAGTVGGTKCAGPAISLKQLGDGWRIGVPVWSEGGEPKADIAVWKATSFDLKF